MGQKTEAAKSMEQLTRRSNPTLAPSLPLVTDVNLTERQTFYLRLVYSNWIGIPTSIYAVILQHMANTFGSVSQDPLLLNGLLMFASWQAANLPAHNQQTKYEHYTFKRNFFETLKSAILQTEIREEYFLALALATVCADVDGGFNMEKSTFRQMLLRVLGHLNNWTGTPQRLRYMYGYILFLLRRDNLFKCIRDRLPENFSQYDESYELYEAGKTVPVPTRSMDPRIFLGSSDWVQQATNIQTDVWQGMGYRLWDDLHSLVAAFALHLRRVQVPSSTEKISEIIDTVRNNLSAIEKHSSIAFFLEDVFIPANALMID